MQSVSSEQVRSAADTRGKHKISAELKRLEQETRFLEALALLDFLTLFTSLKLRKYTGGTSEGLILDLTAVVRDYSEELEQLEKMEKASASCREVLSKVETRPDPLLPTTNGPVNQSWDRWFEGPQENSGCKCWIL